MTNYTVSQGTLFPQKEDFNPLDFEKQCFNGPFVSCVRQGVVEAMKILENIMLNVKLCTRNKSSILNDLIAEYVKINIEKHMSDEPIHCYVDPPGNKRNITTYGAYTFIFRKNIDSRNDTEIARKIEEQELDRHIITISYSTDALWANITSLSLLYIQNNNTLYMRSIDINDYNGLSFENSLQTNNVTQIAKPILKTKSKAQEKKKLA